MSEPTTTTASTPARCRDCGNTDCPNVDADPYWRRCPAAPSPLAWARTCRAGDRYSYAAHAMVPVLTAELDALIDVCAERGIELFADSKGLRAEVLP